ncbi:hypothetical protein CPB86DRAFT_782033 [Serendipita vermifera]|nr:hypothetical protein CPB86DRAFT_782033 [Serendipita vermifera]
MGSGKAQTTSLLPADILLLVASLLDVNTLVSFSQAFRSIYSLSQSSVSWWQHDLAVAYLPSIKPVTSYSLQELRNAALCAHRAWSKFSQPAPLFNIDAPLVEKLNGNRRTALSYIDRIQTEPICFEPHYANVGEERSSEIIVPGTPYLFYILETTNTEDQNPSTLLYIVFRHLRKPGVYQRWELPPGKPTPPRSEPIPRLAALKMDHRTIRLAVLRPGGNWYTAFIRLVEVKLLDTNTFEDSLEQGESENTIHRQPNYGTLTLLWAMQMPSVAEEVVRQKNRVTSAMPKFLFRAIQSGRTPSAEIAYGTCEGVIRPPGIFEIEQDIVYWVQNVGDRTSSSPYCAPLVTVVEYHDTGEAERASAKRFTFKIGRWTPGKEKYQDAISATLIRAPSPSIAPQWTLVLVINTQAPCVYVIPSSYIANDNFMIDSLFQPPPPSMDECICRHDLTLPTALKNDPSESHIRWPRRNYGPDQPGGILHGLRLYWDRDIVPVSPKSLPQSWWEHLSEGAHAEPMVYRMSAFGLSHTSPKHPNLTQSWFYHVYMFFSDPEPPSSPSDWPVARTPPRVRLHIPSPQRGLRFKMEYPQAGMESGIAWITMTLRDTGSILFLQNSGSNTHPPSIIDSTVDVGKDDESGHGGEDVSDGTPKPEIVGWPFMYTDGLGLDLISLRAGVAYGPYSWRRHREPKELDIFKLDELK